LQLHTFTDFNPSQNNQTLQLVSVKIFCNYIFLPENDRLITFVLHREVQ